MPYLSNIILGVSMLFVLTSLGSSLVFFFKKEISTKLNVIFMGFAAGVMIAASIWSLLLPALEFAQPLGKLNFLPVSIGFIGGCFFLVLLDKVCPLLLKKSAKTPSKQQISKPMKLFLAVTIHNIPEGFAVGIAYGAAIVSAQPAAFMTALGLSIGISLQNFPEGAAISLPMLKQKGSKFKAFLYGAFSGAVEPIAAVLGILLATTLTKLMPWTLSFAAGAMLFVVAEDLIPDAKLDQYKHLGTWSVMAGFVVMMIMDVVLSMSL